VTEMIFIKSHSANMIQYLNRILPTRLRIGFERRPCSNAIPHHPRTYITKGDERSHQYHSDTD
jgi:hypothetical protein